MNAETWDLIAKHLAHKTSALEEQELSTWLAQDPANRKAFEAQKKIWQLTEFQKSDMISFDVESSLLEVKQKINIPASPIILQKDHTPKLIPWRPIWGIAAAIALLIGCIFIFKNSFQNTQDQDWVAIQTQTDTQEVVLPDSSKVFLNRNTKFSYARDFGVKNRVVYLTGEAFFEVRKNEKQSFIIYTDEAKTEVLGTSFNLRAYGTEKQVELVVKTGLVSFSDKAHEASSKILVKPNYKAVFEKESKSITQFINDDTNFLSWKNKTLTFQGTALAQMFKTLESYYSIKIEVKDKAILEENFSGNFTNPQLAEVLEILKISLGLKYEVKDKTYIFSYE